MMRIDRPEVLVLLPFETMLTNPYRIYVADKGFEKGKDTKNRMSRRGLDNLSSLAKISHLIAQ